MTIDEENIIAIKSFDNLVTRKSIWFPKYDRILYHPGQLDILESRLKHDGNIPHLYVVASQDLDDIEILLSVFKSYFGQRKSLILKPHNVGLEIIESHRYIVPLKYISCTVANKDTSELGFFDKASLEQLLRYQMANKQARFELVPIVITKDLASKNRMSIMKQANLCIQILEPYLVSEYVSHIHFQDPSAHLTQHMEHDLNLASPILPSHLVAFLLLHLDRGNHGISHEDLIDYLDWLRSVAMEFDLHFVFWGDSDCIIQSAIGNLCDHILIDKKNRIYRAIDQDALMNHAAVMAPNFACYGVISRAILKLYNRDPKNSFCLSFDPDIRMRVMKDDLIELSNSLAQTIEQHIPIRKPCKTIETHVLDVFNKMLSFGRYFKIEEPLARRHTKVAWAGDYDSDEEYYLTKQNDPAFKAWVVLTQRPYRLDRLSLFMNSIDIYL